MKRRGGGLGWVALPGLAWLLAFVAAPLLVIGATAFLSRSDLGEVVTPWTLGNFRRLAGWDELGFDPLYPRVLLRTLLFASGVTLACLAGALPMAFFLARLGRAGRATGLTLIVVPFWTSLLVRTYAWQVVLGPEGPLAWLWSLVSDAEVPLLYPGWFAVSLGAFCDFLPFMVLPVYASVEKVDWTLGEAAADLGAGPAAAFRHAIWPQILPGVVSGCALVFLPCLGQFVIPELLGGGRVTLLGSLVQQQFGSSRDWPFGSAAAAVMILLLLGTLWLLRRRGITTQEGLP